jgi:hypothetical protein
MSSCQLSVFSCQSGAGRDRAGGRGKRFPAEGVRDGFSHEQAEGVGDGFSHERAAYGRGGQPAPIRHCTNGSMSKVFTAPSWLQSLAQR